MTEPKDPPAAEEAGPRRRIPSAEIAGHARLLWERYGKPSGRDEQIWLEAERTLRGLDLRNGRVAARLAGPASTFIRQRPKDLSAREPRERRAPPESCRCA